MAKQFHWIRPNGEWSPKANIRDTMNAARRQIDKGFKPYTLKKDDKVIARGLRRKILHRLRLSLEETKLGPTFRVRDTGQKKILFTVRRVENAIKIINTNGNAKADRAWSFGKAKYPDCTFLGAYVCKRIAGSYTVSQHSYGNAVDFGRNNMDELWDLAYYMVAHSDELDLDHVIVANRIWTRGEGWHAYTGQYHYHVHVDFVPQYSGPCGVRG